jgi:polyhydroxyalkanoate synthesis regulator phasin
MAMGIFSKLFGPSSDIEKQLEAVYVPMIQMKGMTLTEAKSIFSDMIKKIKEESLKEGSSKLPQNFGDLMLENESTNPHFKSMLTRKRRENVRDEDIRWWWNMHDLERRMMAADDEFHSLAIFIKLQKDGLSAEEAGKIVKKDRLIYGDPDNTSASTGDDRPLPFELKDRINIYIQERFQTDPEKLKNEIAESSSFNALIRKEIVSIHRVR